MELHSTLLIFFASCTLNTYGMDFNVHTIPVEVTQKIFTEVALTLETSKQFRETPYILQVPKKLQTLAPLRLVHKPWQQLLTIHAMLELLDISKEDLARWQCRYAADKHIMCSKLESQIQNLEKQKDPATQAIVENLNLLQQGINVSFNGMMHLLKNKIVDPNMQVRISCAEYTRLINDDKKTTHEAPAEYFDLSLLHYAIRLDAHRHFVELLIHAGADIHCDIQDHRVRTPLYISMLASNQVVSMLLLVLGANLDQQDDNKNTLLHSVTKNPLLGVVINKVTVAHDFATLGANIDIPNNEGTTIRQQYDMHTSDNFGTKCLRFVALKVKDFASAKIKSWYDDRHKKYLRGESPF